MDGQAQRLEALEVTHGGVGDDARTAVGQQTATDDVADDRGIQPTCAVDDEDVARLHEVG